MPLKPVFPRAPFTRAAFAYLPYTSVTTLGSVGESLKRLIPALCAAPSCGSVLAALLPAAYLVGDPAAEKAEAQLAEAVACQNPDGSYQASNLEEQIALAQALTVWYEAKRPEQVLPSLLKFCQYVKDHWELIGENSKQLACAGELMQLFSWLYHVTGKKPLLKLMDHLRLNAVDWTSHFHTFSVVKPMERVTPLAEMEAAMAQENGDIGGFYTRQYYMTHGVYVAKSLKTPALFAQVSGNIKEKSAAKAGYEKMMRYHGTACGMFNANPLLGGGDPSQTFDTLAAGELAQSLAEIYQLGGENWASDSLERLVYNAVMAAENQGMIQPVQAVNTADTACCPFVQPAEDVATLCALTRGLNALARSAYLITEDGALVINHLEDGQMIWKVANTKVRLAIAGAYPSGETMKLTVNTKAPAEFEVKLRIPSWCNDACVTVNDDGGDAPGAGELFVMKRTWKNGDVITVNLPSSIKLERWYHQSAALVKGAEVLALDASVEAWNKAIDATTIGTEGVQGYPVSGWDMKDGKVMTPPVAPKAEGKAEELKLAPYAQCRTHIAQLPVVAKG